MGKQGYVALHPIAVCFYYYSFIPRIDERHPQISSILYQMLLYPAGNCHGSDKILFYKIIISNAVLSVNLDAGSRIARLFFPEVIRILILSDQIVLQLPAE